MLSHLCLTGCMEASARMQLIHFPPGLTGFHVFTISIKLKYLSKSMSKYFRHFHKFCGTWANCKLLIQLCLDYQHSPHFKKNVLYCAESGMCRVLQAADCTLVKFLYSPCRLPAEFSGLYLSNGAAFFYKCIPVWFVSCTRMLVWVMQYKISFDTAPNVYRWRYCAEKLKRQGRRSKWCGRHEAVMS